MTEYVKTPHTAIWSGPPGIGKTQLVLYLLEREYKHHFENIVILCPTLKWNETYQSRPWIWKDDYVFLIEPRDKLFEWIEKLSTLFAGEETLFIADDIIADENLDKKRQPLLELAISGRHRKHYLWFLTQSYTAIPKNLRRQCKMLFTWYPKERSDMKLIDEETNIFPDGKINEIKENLKQSKHVCYIRLEHPRCYKIINEAGSTKDEATKLPYNEKF